MFANDTAILAHATHLLSVEHKIISPWEGYNRALSLDQVVDIVQRQENPDTQETVSGDVSQDGFNGADFTELICQLVHPEGKRDSNGHHGECRSRTKECRVQDEGAFLHRQGDHSAKKKSRRFRTGNEGERAADGEGTQRP